MTENNTTPSGSRLKFKETLDRGHTAIATFEIFKGVRAAQILAHTGVDAVIVDCEHGNVDDADMHDMVATIAAAGVSPLIRLAGLTGEYIKRALDTGAHGILVPMINNADDVRFVVNHSKFPPVGIRGQGSQFAYFSHGFATPAEYVANANKRLVLMAQIETAEGLKNIDEICQVHDLGKRRARDFIDEIDRTVLDLLQVHMIDYMSSM